MSGLDYCHDQSYGHYLLANVLGPIRHSNFVDVMMKGVTMRKATRRAAAKRGSQGSASPRRHRPRFESLEQRVVLATVFDFTVDNGGFTTRGQFGSAPWEYTGANWHSIPTFDESSAISSFLESPTLTAEESSVTVILDHEFDFSAGAGAQVNLRTNGGPFTLANPEVPYPHNNVGAFFQPGWIDSSGGRVTDTFILDLAVGDEFQLQFRAGWRDEIRGDNWRIHTITIGEEAAATAEVMGRQLLYNNSFFDDEDPAANEADDDALAIDKTALLPGQTATFANYSSYSRGINGVVIDIAGLASEPTVETIGDFFAFHQGNDDAPDAWPEAAAPTDVSVRAEAGVDGSDRVTLLWEDNAVENSWLQTTILGGDATGLSEDDVFYFGNAVGESGNSAADASVNAQDIGGARDNPHNFLNRALVDDMYDYSRDSLTNAQDIGIARDNPTNFLNDLNLISPPAAAPAAGGGQVENSELPTAPLDNQNAVPLAPTTRETSAAPEGFSLVDDAYWTAEGNQGTDSQDEIALPAGHELPSDLLEQLAEDSSSAFGTNL